MPGAAARQVLTEVDPEDGDDDDGVVEQPGGEQPGTLRPLETPAIQHEPPASGDATEYEIVETDDSGTAREESLGGQSGETVLERRQREQREASDLGISRSTMRRKRASEERRANKAEIARLKAESAASNSEIAELRGRLEKVEPRLSEFDAARQQGQIQQIDQALEVATRALTECDDRQMQAMADNDPAAFRKAQSEGREAYLNVERLKFQKKQLAAAPAARTTTAPASGRDTGTTTDQPDARRRPAETAAPARLSPAAQAHTDEFIEDHDWFDPAGTNDDSQVVLAIDNLIARRGFKPDTREYWEELDRRMRIELPHRFADSEAAGSRRASETPARAATEQPRATTVPAQRRGPMTAGAGDRPAGGGKVQVYIDPERKAALIQGGYVNPDGSVPNRAKLDRVLANYAQADAERAAARR